METVLRVEQVNKWFKDHHALHDISFTASKGNILGILGPNGAGKSTTIRILMGILLPDEGAVRYSIANGQAIPQHKIGFLPEERGLYKNEQVMDIILYLANLKNYDLKKARTRAMDYLDRFDLSGHENSKIQELSKGMAQKVQFIASIIHEPEFLVLDEV
jgi:ABC-2 type transport system ATP-binding protein